MKLNFLFAPLLALLVGCASPIAPTPPTQAAPTAPFALAPGVSIYLGANEPEPALLAARDLACDCETVLGTPAPIVRNRAQLDGQPFIEIIGPQTPMRPQKATPAPTSARRSARRVRIG